MKTNVRLFLFFISLLWIELSFAQDFSVSWASKNRLQIKSNTVSKKDKFDWSSLPDSRTDAKLLAIHSNNDTITLNAAHPILRHVSKNKNYYAAPRLVALQGAINFRDLGGYQTKDGKQVKWGKIYRSADISKLTDSDLNILSDLRIRMVCDFRGEQEVSAAPDRIPEGTERILLSAGSENVGTASSFAKYLKDPVKADSMLKALYTRTDHLAKKYKPVFDQLLSLEKDNALMFHCTAGKDRTGIGAALILASLDVDQETILQDYELTNEYSKALMNQFMARAKTQGFSEQAANNMMAAKREYLQATFKAIQNQFGSFDQFLTKEMGLTPEKRNQLKSKFLY